MRLQVVRTAKVLLDVVRTGSLPVVVLVAEDASMVTDLFDDGAHGLLLLLLSGDSSVVGRTTSWPTDLGDEFTLGSSLGADLGSLLKLVNGKLAGLRSSLSTIEEGLDLSGKDIDDVAPCASVLFPGSNGFGSGDRSVEASGAELGTDSGNVGSESASITTVTGDVLVTDDEHRDTVLGCLGDNVVQLVVGTLGTGGAVGVKEDAVDDLEAVLLACRNDVLKNTAVGAVHTDSGVAESRDLANINLDLGLGLAVTAGRVGGVGDGPLVAIGLVPGTRAIRRSAGLAGLGLRGNMGGRCRGSRVVAGNLLGGLRRRLDGHIGGRRRRRCLRNVTSRRGWNHRLLRGRRRHGDNGLLRGRRGHGSRGVSSWRGLHFLSA